MWQTNIIKLRGFALLVICVESTDDHCHGRRSVRALMCCEVHRIISDVVRQVDILTNQLEVVWRQLASEAPRCEQVLSVRVKTNVGKKTVDSVVR